MHLRGRYKIVAAYSGVVGSLAGLFILFPLVVLPFYPGEARLAPAFAIPGLFLVFAGMILWRAFAPREAPRLSPREGAVVVVGSWMMAILAGTVVRLGATSLDVTEALFESTSGWTTTGLSVIDVTRTSRLVLLFRSTMQLAGGAGFAIVVLSLFRGQLGPGLTTAEGRADQLVPHVRQSASIVLRMYGAYVVVGIFGFHAAGMEIFDSVNHAFAAVSTGGFSTRTESIGYWDSVYVEAVALGLMLLGTTNFLTSYAVMRGKLHVARRSAEFRLMGITLLLAVPLILLTAATAAYPSLDKSLRVAVFESMTALSTTGFSTVGYNDWPDVSWMILLVLMVIGGGSGSTAGGSSSIVSTLLLKVSAGKSGSSFSRAQRSASRTPGKGSIASFSPIRMFSMPRYTPRSISHSSREVAL